MRQTPAPTPTSRVSAGRPAPHRDQQRAPGWEEFYAWSVTVTENNVKREHRQNFFPGSIEEVSRFRLLQVIDTS